MSIFEYDKELEEKKLRRAEFQAGMEAGIEKGIEQGIAKGQQDLLTQKIYIDEAKTEKGKKEYSSYIVKNNMYYQISGVMSKREFEKIVENLFLEKY